MRRLAGVTVLAALAAAAVAAIVVVLVLVLGGEDRLSQPEFARQGDALCADLERRSGALGQARDLEGIARQLDEVAKIGEDTHRRLGELKPPEDRQAAFDGYLQSLQRQIDKARELADAARRNDEPALRT